MSEECRVMNEEELGMKSEEESEDFSPLLLLTIHY
jgi:hypothetical protein